MQIVSSHITEKGQITLPEQVRKILGLKHKHSIVGFVIDGKEIKVVKARVVEDKTLTPDEISLMAKWSKEGKGKISFKNTNSALEYLWRI